MKRLLSILLLAAFALPLVAPLLALAQDPDAGLPACCRRHGQHHCSMPEGARAPSGHGLYAVCAAWPQRAVPASAVSQHLAAGGAGSAVSLTDTLVSAAMPRTASLPLSERLHPKRGPPAHAPAIL